MTWKTYSIAQIIEDVQSGFACGNKDVVNGFLHLRMNNIHSDGKLDLTLLRRVPPELVGSKYRLKKGDVVVCTTNSGKLVGKSALFDIEGEYAFSNHLTRLRLKKDIAEPTFVQKLFWLKWQLGEIEPLCKHWVNQSTLPKDALLALEFQLPPLVEQRRIARKLDRIAAQLDEVKARLATIPSLLKRFRQSILATACSGRLTNDWRNQKGRDIEPALVVIEKIRLKLIQATCSVSDRRKLISILDLLPIIPGLDAGLPENWVACSIGSIGYVTNGSTPSRKMSEYWNGDIPWVSSGEVKNSIISSTRERISQKGYDNSSVRMLPKGTVLLAMIGEGKTRGQTAIINISSCINQNVAAVVIDHGFVLAKYLWFWFQGQYESNREAGSGSGPQALNCQRVRELPFHLPPLNEQVEIVRRVEELMSQADAIEARYNKAMVFVDKLMPSILAKAFRGELA